MLEGRDFIVFSDDWGRHPFSCQHLMRHFLAGNRLLWVNTIGMRRPRLALCDLRRGMEKIASWTVSRKEEVREGPMVLSPPMWPFARKGPLRSFNRHSVIRSVRAAMRAHRFRSPILLATVPNASEVLGAFDEVLTVYYCVDEFAEWPGVDRVLVREMDEAMLARADLVVAVSDELYRRKRPRSGQIRLLTHGVDPEHFRHASCARDCPPAPLRDLPRPVAGYFGLIDERTDQALIEHLVRARPGWSFVALGKAVTDLGRLERYPNFHHLEAVPYEALPCHVRAFDLCILPYVRNTLTDNINPLKLKEYLASGKPVVSTALPEAVKMEPHVRTASGAEEFLARMEEALAAGSPGPHLRQLLQEESWTRKARQLSEWMEEALEGRREAAPEFSPLSQKGWSHAR